MTTPELHFTRPAELIAALPHLLGFVPSDDLVAILVSPFDGPEPALEVRAAIGCTVTVTETQARSFATTCSLSAQQFPAAVLIAVCDATLHPQAVTVCDAARESLRERGIAVPRMFSTRSVTEAGHWVDLDTAERGATHPYTDSPATALGVLQGRVIASSRADMHREFTPAEAAPPIGLPAEVAAMVAATAADLRALITGRGEPGAELAARTGVLVSAHIGLRDRLLRQALGHEHTAGRVFTQLAAHHRGRPRAELLTMAALAYYAGEDTTRADMALRFAAEAAAEAHSGLPRLADMVATALRAGVAPEQIRRLLSKPIAPSPPGAGR